MAWQKKEIESFASIQDQIRNEIKNIRASEENTEKARGFSVLDDDEDDGRIRAANPWDLPDEELWLDGIAPPTFVEFVEGKEFMEGELFPKQKEAIVNSIGNSPREVFYPRIDLEEYEERLAAGEDLEGVDIYSIIVLMWGKGSGKDFIVAYLIAWLAYVINSMKDPWAYFTHEYGEAFEAINVAKNAEQAKKVFFEKVKNNLSKKCFEKFPFREKQDEIVFMRRLPKFNKDIEMLRLYSRHSQSGSYEGHNLIFFVMDEASSFELKGSNKLTLRQNDQGDDIIPSPADDIYNTLKTSAASRFGPHWLGFIISFPRTEGDFTMRLYDDSQRKDEATGNPLYPYIYGDRAKTWEVNIRVREKDLAQFYRENPEDSKLKFECIPPPAKGGFFSLHERIDASFDNEIMPAILWSPGTSKSFDGQSFVSIDIDSMHLSPNYTYFAHFDPGLSGDSFAFALCHPNWTVQEQVHDPNGKEYSIPQVVVDAVLVWQPDKRRRTSVDFLNVNEVILRIAKSCHLAYCTADHWNSEHLKQSLQKAHVRVDFEGGTNKEQLAMYKNLKTVMYRGLLRICGSSKTTEYPALAKARDEMRRLELVNGVKVDHPYGGSKDISDAIAGAVFLASQRGVGVSAFSDWNNDKKDDMLMLNNTELLKKESKMFSAPSGKQISDYLKGARLY